ncbi:hypothetical protein SAMN05421753_112123 [Planctomicrobium piriforme]|uniref:Uncharacterized protein n=1 Tax=Planctomicrobium piriforme TaxID=1576369 RepID=A0A1I3L391_9PLAN|nr:hypothetical protein SAMN05421753_112123 [Planctomicrobium piriforme]
METPKVKTEVYIEKLNSRFIVFAYRTLTELELRQCWALFRGQKMGRKLKKNSTYTVYSIIGYRD